MSPGSELSIPILQTISPKLHYVSQRISEIEIMWRVLNQECAGRRYNLKKRISYVGLDKHVPFKLGLRKWKLCPENQEMYSHRLFRNVPILCHFKKNGEPIVAGVIWIFLIQKPVWSISDNEFLDIVFHIYFTCLFTKKHNPESTL